MCRSEDANDAKLEYSKHAPCASCMEGEKLKVNTFHPLRASGSWKMKLWGWEASPTKTVHCDTNSEEWNFP